jgi:type IX secretion system PorP/SprF family membrane protein
MFRQVLICSLALSWVCPVFSQDPVFSQFYAAPLHLNPAFAGVTYAPRVTLNYRNQWPSWPNAYVTYAVAYEQPLEALNSGLGFTAMADNAGDGIYRTLRLNGVYGYQVRLKDDFFIHFGVEAGIIQTRLDWDRLLFLDQIDPISGPRDAEGNLNLSEEQRPASLGRTVFDVSAGMMVSGGSFYGGISVKHLNRPDESILSVNDNLGLGLPMRVTLHGGMEIPLERNNRQSPTFISPNVLYIQQAGFGQLNAGAYAGFGQIFGGLWYRHTFNNPDAAIALLGYRYGVLRIGYSYDFTVSRLANNATGGTHEISLSFNFDDSAKLQAKRHRSRYSNCFKMFN